MSDHEMLSRIVIRCMECGARFDGTVPLTSCSACGGLLDVMVPLGRQMSPDEFGRGG
jgi:hypothetical protein